jgi:hypothetical protein
MRSTRNCGCDGSLLEERLGEKSSGVPKTITKAILWLGAVVLVGYFVWWFAPGYFKAEADPRSQEFLSKLAAEINRSAPVMIDPATELISVAGADGMLIYNYRLVGYSAVELDHQKFRDGARERVTQAACNTPDTRDGLLKKGVILRYSYFDKYRQHIASVDVKPSDCGF